MKEIVGKYNTAKIFTDVVDDKSIEQVKLLLANLEQRIAALEENVGMKKNANEKIEEDELVWVNDCPNCQCFNVQKFNVCPNCKLQITKRMIHKRIGRWTLDMFGDYKCSVCESRYSIPYGTCPRCNTEMKTYDEV